jgi:hypothetical protein
MSEARRPDDIGSKKPVRNEIGFFTMWSFGGWEF